MVASGARPSSSPTGWNRISRRLHEGLELLQRTQSRLVHRISFLTDGPKFGVHYIYSAKPNRERGNVKMAGRMRIHRVALGINPIMGPYPGIAGLYPSRLGFRYSLATEATIFNRPPLNPLPLGGEEISAVQ